MRNFNKKSPLSNLRHYCASCGALAAAERELCPGCSPPVGLSIRLGDKTKRMIPVDDDWSGGSGRVMAKLAISLLGLMLVLVMAFALFTWLSPTAAPPRALEREIETARLSAGISANHQETSQSLPATPAANGTQPPPSGTAR